MQRRDREGARFCDSCGAALAGPSAAPATAPAEPLPESFGAGRYKVSAFLGRGGVKKVYLARDIRLDRDVAVAVVEGLAPDGMERVRREAQAVARLGDHPHIVGVHDTGTDAGALYTVYQYMAGGSIETALGNAEGHRLPLDLALRLAAQVCDALDFAHARGIIHRDLKPSNVFLTGEGSGNQEAGSGAEGARGGRQAARPELVEGRQGGWAATVTAKLGDFGLAHALDRSRLSAEGTMLGTPLYMAPEQAMGRPPDPRSDLYSLGCLLYEMLTGRPPFVGDDTVAVVTQHLNTPPGGALLASPRPPARPRSSGPAPPGEGPLEAPANRRRGPPVPGVCRPVGARRRGGPRGRPGRGGG